MAPKRGRKMVVKTTKKVIQETVEIAVDGTNQVSTMSSTILEQEKEGVTGGEEIGRTIPVEDISEKKTARKTKDVPVKRGSHERDETLSDEETQQQVTEQKVGWPSKQATAHETRKRGRPPANKKVEGKEAKRTKSQGDDNNKGGQSRTKRRKRGENVRDGYRRYVYRVLKQVHPDLGMTSMAMTVLNNYMSDMFERLADEAARLSKYTGRRTLSSKEIQDAVRLVLPGELGKHAIAEGTKAVTTYMKANVHRINKT